MSNDLIQEARDYIGADNHSPDGYAEDLVRRLLTAYAAQAAVVKEALQLARCDLRIVASYLVPEMEPAGEATLGKRIRLQSIERTLAAIGAALPETPLAP